MDEMAPSLYELVNSAVADLMLVDATDKGPLGNIATKMEHIAAMSSLPIALITMAKRIGTLTEMVILESIPYEEGLIQLTDGLNKLQHNIKNYSGYEDTSDKYNRSGVPRKSQDTSEYDEVAAPSDMIDLFIKFGQQLSIALEDFEMYVLEYEKGIVSSIHEIKRMLHTWKGEFGVLDVKDYVTLIHTVEEQIVLHDTCKTDNLFKIKDLLEQAAEKCKKGIVPVLPEDFSVMDESFSSETHEGESVSQKIANSTEEDRSVSPSVNDKETSKENADIEIDPNADKGLLADFVTEAHDHIHRAESLLLELEIDPTKIEYINTIFRACHTIKGVAGFLSLKTLTKVAHSTENLMDQIRKGTLTLNPTKIDLLFEAFDCLKEMVVAIAGVIEGIPFEVPESAKYIITRLEKIVAGESDAKSSEPQEKMVGELLVEQGAVSKQQVKKALKKQNEGDQRPIGEILIDEKIPARAVGKALATQTNTKNTAVEVEETIRVPVKRLDMLIDAIGEGVIAQSMVYANSSVAGLKDLALEKKIAQSMLIMRQIQEMSMSLRMVALRSTFQKMARLVRDLSKKVGKNVEFVMEGEDTELDKSVVENIGDPLIHMIRNSLDHGIESSAERLAAGKNEKAKIMLRAYHKAGSVCIEIEDDGRGLNSEKIFQKAIERGLCKASDSLNDHEIFQFIFMPGFSTAEEVTDISGRGVGMDVVQRNITALRGAIDINSVAGKGTLFTIKLPLTLAIINGMIVRLKNERYIVPTLSILESVLPTKDQIVSVVGQGEMLKIRGELVRLIRMEELFFGSNGKLRNKHEGIALLVEDAMGRKIALFVDEIIDQQQVVIKNLGEGLGEIPGVAGGAIMSDGTISLIIDVAGVVRIAS